MGIQAYVLDEKGTVHSWEWIRTDVEGNGHFYEKIKRMDDDVISVVIEATSFYFGVYDVVAEHFIGLDAWGAFTYLLGAGRRAISLVTGSGWSAKRKSSS